MNNLFFCPKCSSRNVGAIYTVPVGKVWYRTTTQKDRCQDCRYEELRGHFEIINLQKAREQKIESILNGVP